MYFFTPYSVITIKLDKIKTQNPKNLLVKISIINPAGKARITAKLFLPVRIRIMKNIIAKFGTEDDNLKFAKKLVWKTSRR